MQNNQTVVNDCNIGYQVTVRDVDVTETPEVTETTPEAPVETPVEVHTETPVEAPVETDDTKVITFITGASGKSRNGNLTQNKYQILANELSQELETHKQMITDKMASLDKSQKVITELQSVISKQNSQINDHATKAQMYIETIKDLQQKVDFLSSQNGASVSDLQNENDNLNNEMMVLQSSILKLHHDRDLKSIEMNQLQEQHQKLQDLLSAKIKELTLFQTEHTYFKNQVELYKDTNDKLQQELDVVKLTMSEMVMPVVPVVPDVVETVAQESFEEPGLDRVVGNIRVQRNVRRANPPRRR